MALPSVIIYTSSTGGTSVRATTERMLAILKAHTKSIHIEYIDIDLTTKKRALRQQIWKETGLKGVWPLVYVNNKFLGTCDAIEKLNEQQQLNLALNCLQTISQE